MDFLTLFFIFIGCIIFYLIYSSYSFQLLYHKLRIKKVFLSEFKDKVKGIYVPKAYFASSHKIVGKKEYRSFSSTHKTQFNLCYNIITFKTEEANWELFFHLVKEGTQMGEVLNLRVFPKHNRIKSEGNVEKSYSRLNIFTNNRYLTGILEENKANDHLKWLIRHNEDILLISSNNLHFKAFLSSNKMSVSRVMDMVKSLHYIKNKIYKKGVIEY